MHGRVEQSEKGFCGIRPWLIGHPRTRATGTASSPGLGHRQLGKGIRDRRERRTPPRLPSLLAKRQQAESGIWCKRQEEYDDHSPP